MANDYLNLVIWPDDTDEEQTYRPMARIQWGGESVVDVGVGARFGLEAVGIEFDITELKPYDLPSTPVLAKAHTKPAPPNLSRLEDWKTVHSAHGKGPWFEVTVNGHETWRCAGCGEKKIFTNGIAKEP